MKSSDITTYRHISGDSPLPYIDCDRCIRKIYARIHHYISQSEGRCPICNYFAGKIGTRDGSEEDARLLIHAQINLVFELFERNGDEEYLELLHRVEDDCC